MTTRLVGLKDFRQNLSSYTKDAKKHDIRFIVLRKNTPVLEVKSVDEKEFAYEKLKEEIAEARKQAEKGEVYTEEEMMEEFGLI